MISAVVGVALVLEPVVVVVGVPDALARTDGRGAVG